MQQGFASDHNAGIFQLSIHYSDIAADRFTIAGVHRVLGKRPGMNQGKVIRVLNLTPQQINLARIAASGGFVAIEVGEQCLNIGCSGLVINACHEIHVGSLKLVVELFHPYTGR